MINSVSKSLYREADYIWRWIKISEHICIIANFDDDIKVTVYLRYVDRNVIKKRK